MRVRKKPERCRLPAPPPHWPPGCAPDSLTQVPRAGEAPAYCLTPKGECCRLDFVSPFRCWRLPSKGQRQVWEVWGAVAAGRNCTCGATKGIKIRGDGVHGRTRRGLACKIEGWHPPDAHHQSMQRVPSHATPARTRRLCSLRAYVKPRAWQRRGLLRWKLPEALLGPRPCRSKRGRGGCLPS